MTRLKRKAYKEAIPKTQLRDIVSPSPKLVKQFEVFGGEEYVPWDSSMWRRIAMSEGGYFLEDGETASL
jgi:hypothetical protein